MEDVPRVVGFDLCGVVRCVGTVMAGVLNPIDAQLCAPGANAASDGKCPINDTELKYDADAVQVLTWTLRLWLWLWF